MNQLLTWETCLPVMFLTHAQTMHRALPPPVRP